MRQFGFVTLGIVILIILGIASFFVGTYNRLQVMDEAVSANWAQVENQLKRRNDLIPNLVNTVKGYATHENEIFTNIAEARAKLSGAMGANDVKAVQHSNNKSFIGLQDELAGTENRLTVARRDYNESVKSINAMIRTFPTSLVAGLTGIKQREYFEISEAEKEAPKVEF